MIQADVSAKAAFEVIAQAAAATSFAKVLVDICKTSAIPTPSWVLPLLALAFGWVCAFALLIFAGGTVTAQTIAGVFLVGIMAAGGAIGVTELHRRANPDENK